ncbi:hypothetical protein [Fodinicola acaciae]|uniref:hypothetical protein n=1 Tax=Fodinicola acaciae TaxID=2681555 RepID=UPI0013D8BDA1|nr:hypothetical protein [Fodinicola acaciae]
MHRVPHSEFLEDFVRPIQLRPRQTLGLKIGPFGRAIRTPKIEFDIEPDDDDVIVFGPTRLNIDDDSFVLYYTIDNYADRSVQLIVHRMPLQGF